MAGKKKNGIEATTFLNYSYAIQRFKQYFENCEMADIKREHVEAAFVEMTKKYAKNSIYNVRQVMAAVFSAAKDEQLVFCNPFKKAKIPVAASEKTVDAYTLEEQRCIVKAASDDPLGHIYIFLLLTGLRRSELVNLKWSDYNEHKRCISITKSKTASGIRTVALSAKANYIIQSLHKLPHGYIFSNTRGNPISFTSLKKLYLRLEREVGFDLTNHKCRHTFCTRLVEAEVDPKTICTLSGHRSVAFMMQRYVTSTMEQQRMALHCLDELF